MRRRLACLLFLALIAFSASVQASEVQASEEIKVVLNGSPLSFDVPPAIVDGRTLVPLRATFHALGAEVSYDSATRTVSTRRAGTTVTLTIGQTYAMVGDRTVTLDVPPQIIQGRTLVPVRFVAEALGAVVSYVPPTRTVLITTDPAALPSAPAPPAPPPAPLAPPAPSPPPPLRFGF